MVLSLDVGLDLDLWTDLGLMDLGWGLVGLEWSVLVVLIDWSLEGLQLAPVGSGCADIWAILVLPDHHLAIGSEGHDLP